MKTLSILAVSFSIAMLSSSCNQNANCDQGTPDPNCICYEIYAPVCGCDDVTYSNDCYAECAGITDYTEGECD